MKTQTSLSTSLNTQAARLILVLLFIFAAGAANGQLTDALKIKIAKGSYSDEAVIRFIDGGTNGFDSNYESWKLFSTNAAVPNIYSKDSLDDKLAINALAPFNESVTVDVYLKIGTAGTYSISSTILGAFAPGTRMMLKDLTTNISYDLRTGTVHTFSLPVLSSSSAARFRVIFSYPAYVEVEPVTCTECTDGTAEIVKSGETTWNYSVVNASGSVVRSGAADSSVTILDGMAAGNYTATITNNFSCSENKTFSIVIEPITLGATFIDVEAVRNEGNVAITWTTGMETNTDFFSVERSGDGVDFENIDRVGAAGHSSVVRSYSSVDMNSKSGVAYYRVKLTDNNGSISYSKVTSVRSSVQGALTVFPIPAVDNMNVIMEGNNGSEVVISISDMSGRVVFTETVTPDSDRNIYQIPVTSQFTSGVYIITSVDKEKSLSQKIVIQ
jgi:hypothetical protein